MIDNLTLVKECEPMPQLYKAKGKPFEYNGLMYLPKYDRYGKVVRYDAKLKNMVLLVYPTRRYLINSIHKYWHNHNFTDFTLQDAHNAIEDISLKTGVNWFDAKVQNLEIGCNVSTNANKAINSLVSYKSKKYLPMYAGSKQYGSKCPFDLYSVKLYDKEFQLKEADKLNIGKPLVRWELTMKAKYFNRYKLGKAITFEDLLNPNIYNLMVQNATNIFRNTLKKQIMNITGLDATEKKIIAAMQNEAIRESIKLENKHSYKKDRARYNQLMLERGSFFYENTGELIEEKFKELVSKINEKKG